MTISISSSMSRASSHAGHGTSASWPGASPKRCARFSHSSSVRCGAKGLSSVSSVRTAESGRGETFTKAFVQTMSCARAVLKLSASMSAVSFLIEA